MPEGWMPDAGLVAGGYSNRNGDLKNNPLYLAITNSLKNEMSSM